MYKIFFTLFSVLSGLSNTDAIIGRSTGRDEFPFIVSINNIHTTDNSHICGGALISQKHVLTSEHCVYNQRARNLQVLIGGYDLHSGREYNVATIMRFDDWTKRHQSASYPNNDVAILTLEEDVIDVKPGLIDAETSQKTAFYDKDVVTVDRGEDGCSQKSIFLKMLTPAQCNENLYRLTRKRYEINEKYFCTAPYAELGKGDEGSPVLYNNLIIGVNHGTFPDLLDDNDAELNLHIGVDHYRRFIRDMLSID